MSQYRIRGGNRLAGEVRIGGAKNAVLPILAASALNQGESIIHNCPRIQDTFISIKILESIGCKTSFEGNTLIIDASCANSWDIPPELVKEMRSSIIFMGGVLGRFGSVNVSYPGGCALGTRPINLHIKSLRALGATIYDDHGIIRCHAESLTGGRVHLDKVSVGATENIMLAASTAEGETIVNNAAREPEILDLQNFLNGMGADIKGAGTDTIVIRGVKKLHSTEHTVMPDRIVAGTYLAAAAITGGNLKLRRISSHDLLSITAKLTEMGCEIKEYKTEIGIKAPKRLKSLPRLITEPYPGFPTDMQAQFVAALATAEGTSMVHETIFDSRNKHANELQKMGANITVLQGVEFVIQGCERLNGTTVTATDLRGGAALILAGLMAEGETVVQEAHYVQRGYEAIEKALESVGANIILE
ncbi:MAG: UDP-N-acetylglucosamine 1-carboxyvinyltransferase [Clostridiales bacterium]|jgi:UDP-N-acetylglucosamine 1-carboxyvinyltransferase|nr:UDP-N-acetylglucosamine 1-carboxyvinyltransferase [Clostridiales bacterium]